MVNISSIIEQLLGPNITKIRPDCPLKNDVGYYLKNGGAEEYFWNSHESNAMSELGQNTYLKANSTMGLFPSLMYGVCNGELTMDAIIKSERALPFVFDFEQPICGKDKNTTVLETIKCITSRGNGLHIKHNQNGQKIEQYLPDNQVNNCYDTGIIYMGKNPCSGSKIIANFAVSKTLREEQHDVISLSIPNTSELSVLLSKITDGLNRQAYSAAEIITCKQKSTHNLLPFAVAYIK
ncbi:MAG: hypothetical protein KAJ24_07325 [Candidatus Aenigmarchaeota archaeon]|nr:hypothetical protein [Candidatus Aenigmarchaeota archaeon]